MVWGHTHPLGVFIPALLSPGAGRIAGFWAGLGLGIRSESAHNEAMLNRALPLSLSLALATIASAQLPGIGKDRLPGIPGLDAITRKGPAITTNLKDAKFEAAERDSFTPDCKDLATLPRTPNGGFVLAAGAYAASLQSY